eukprot:CAMPEP_0115760430 /NCGR_PEP_ID=MMETSP0272-20121206/99990_1 /TAXON_ID=71861 /ORGANISM="Scrippsiella trochoidea, Strain CCMP3099" /LENGTH=64 /DNA_ID=CAMNT_0003206085 /DNA_START=79 /DNA_END=270 /DNA_ORIENTATION=-
MAPRTASNSGSRGPALQGERGSLSCCLAAVEGAAGASGDDAERGMSSPASGPWGGLALASDPSR